MSVITQDFVAAGKPTYIVANVGVKYTDITDGIMYQQTTMPYGKSWKVISNQNVFIPSAGGVGSVTGSVPIQSSGGTNPNISIPKADATTDGYLSSADWNTFNSGSGGGVPPTRTINTTTPLQGGGDLSADRTLSIAQAGSLTDGFLSAADWGVFDSKFPYPTGTSSQYIQGDGSLATFPTIPSVTPAALTKSDDTNVTLSLTGTPNSALLQAVNIAVGWSGTLADSRIASASTWNSKVSSVGATTPLASTGGSTPTISIQQSSASQDGYLSSTDWTTFNNKGSGTITSVGATGPITSSGGTTPTISTSMATNKLIGRSTAGTGVMEEISIGPGLTLSSGTLDVVPVVSAPIYLVAHDESTQTAASRNTGYPMSIDWIDESNDITINAHTQITFNQDGVYNIQFSAQFSNIDNQLHDVDVWFAKNGAPIPMSNSRFTIDAAHGGDPGHFVAAWNYMATFNIGDFVEIYWETDDTQVIIEKIAAANDAPDTPSIILTVDKL